MKKSILAITYILFFLAVNAHSQADIVPAFGTVDSTSGSASAGAQRTNTLTLAGAGGATVTVTKTPKPTVTIYAPPAQVNSDWAATTGLARILNKPFVVGSLVDGYLCSYTAAGGVLRCDTPMSAGGGLTSIGTSAPTSFAAGTLLGSTGAFLRAATLSDLTTLLGYTPLRPSNNLSDVASAITARSNLGLAIGTDVQAYNANLTTYAGVAPSANALTFLVHTFSQMLTDLGAQASLVSGANIKTINGLSVLGAGDLTVTGGGGLTSLGSSTPTSFASGTFLGSTGTFLRAATASDLTALLGFAPVGATDNVATATALAATPTGCSAGYAPTGVNAAGVAQTCTQYVTPAQFQARTFDFGTDTGTANNYAVAISPAPTLAVGATGGFKATHANTGASTLSVNGGTAVPIVRAYGGSLQALTGGEILTGQIVQLAYDGTNFQMQTPSATTAAGGVTGSSTTGYWAYFNGTNSVAGTAVTSSKVVCSDSSGHPIACTNLTDVTMPTGAVVGTTDTQSLSNKTLINPTITGYTETPYTPTVTSGAVTIDLTNGSLQKVVTAANTTITLPSASAGKSYTILVSYGGAHTITWAGGGTIKFSGGTAPVATSVSGKVDMYTFICHDSTNTYGTDGGRNY